MAINPSFVATPNNAHGAISGSIDPAGTLSWSAGSSGGMLRRVYVRAVADQAVVVKIETRIGGTYALVAAVDVPVTPTGELSSGLTPPFNILNAQTFSGLSESKGGLAFAADDGIRVALDTVLDAGETCTIFCEGGDY